MYRLEALKLLDPGDSVKMSAQKKHRFEGFEIWGSECQFCLRIIYENVSIWKLAALRTQVSIQLKNRLAQHID